MEGILHKHLDLKRVSSDTYSIGWHNDWNVGLSLHGGFIAAGIHLTAVTHLKTELASINQPDILRLHVEFLRPCAMRDSLIKITPLKLGSGTSTLQLNVYQEDKLTVVALATSANFDRPFGPSAEMGYRLDPPIPSIPDFQRATGHLPQPDWIGGYTAGEVMPAMGRLLSLVPREGYPRDGVLSIWNHWKDDAAMDATYLTSMADIFPSMADTLLRNNGLFDAHKNLKLALEWDQKSPGVPITLITTVREALKARTFVSSLTLDLEFKRRVPETGLSWLFTRLSTKLMEDGRIDLSIDLCDDKLQLLVVASQTMLVLDVARQFGESKGARL